MPKKSIKKSTKKTTKLNDSDNIVESYLVKNSKKINNIVRNKSISDKGVNIIQKPIETILDNTNIEKVSPEVHPEINIGDITDTMTLIADKNGTVYMGIHNFYNSFCYYISAIQRLHSSNSLKKALEKDLFNKERLSDSIETHNISKDIMSILIEYNKITDLFNDEKNIKITNKGLYNLSGGSPLIKQQITNIYNNMFEYKKVIDNLFHENLKHGGDPQGIMLYLFFPIIFHYTDEYTFVNILKELNFSPIHFTNTNYGSNVFEVIKDDREDYNKKLENWYQDILKFLNKKKNDNDFNEDTFENQFCVTTLCIYFASVYNRDYSGNSGHAVTFVYGNDDDFYVIDDHKNIRPFNEYVKYKYTNIYEMELKDLTKKTISLMTKWDDYNIDNRIYRTVLKPKTKYAMSGGIKVNEQKYDYSQNYKKKPTMFDVFKWMTVKYKVYFELYCVLLIILILILIIYLIDYIKKRQQLNSINNEIKTKEKQLKKMKEKYTLKNLKLKNIESQSQAMAENFNKSIFTVYDI